MGRQRGWSDGAPHRGGRRSSRVQPHRVVVPARQPERAQSVGRRPPGPTPGTRPRGPAAARSPPGRDRSLWPRQVDPDGRNLSLIAELDGVAVNAGENVCRNGCRSGGSRRHPCRGRRRLSRRSAEETGIARIARVKDIHDAIHRVHSGSPCSKKSSMSGESEDLGLDGPTSCIGV